MDAAMSPDHEAVRALAVAYCEAIHFARPKVLDGLCHENFHMTAVTGSGGAIFWGKADFLGRVGGRGAFSGKPSYDILSIDVAGGEMARVHLWVDVPPRRFEDHLEFLRLGGEWTLMTKAYRTMNGPPLEG